MPTARAPFKWDRQVDIKGHRLTATPAIAPAVTTAPAIRGSAQVGAAASYTQGVYTGYPDPTITRAWLRQDIVIVGATGSTYTPAASEAGQVLKVRETVSNTYGSVQSTSAGVTILAAAGAAAGPVPDAPVLVQATGSTAGQKTISWVAPATVVGGAPIATDPITSFRVRVRRASDNVLLADAQGLSPSTLATTFSGLPAVLMRATVAAINASGASDESQYAEWTGT